MDDSKNVAPVHDVEQSAGLPRNEENRLADDSLQTDAAHIDASTGKGFDSDGAGEDDNTKEFKNQFGDGIDSLANEYQEGLGAAKQEAVCFHKKCAAKVEDAEKMVCEVAADCVWSLNGESRVLCVDNIIACKDLIEDILAKAILEYQK